MSRRFFFMAALLVVMLYFSIILFMLNPLHSARGLSYSNFHYRQVRNVEWCRPLSWRVPPGDVVALASFPGSGNTWLRYLLQQATGIMTGSIYMDHDLRLHGFPAEHVHNGSVLVVKTHEAPDFDMYKSAILLLRNPRDAILAEFNRLHMGHIGTAPMSVFKKKSEEKAAKNLVDWESYLSISLDIWENLNMAWLRNYPGRVHVVFYETLVRNTRRSLADTLAFLRVNYTEADLACALHHREGIYRRRRKHKDFDPFTPEMYLALDSVKSRVLALVNDYKSKIKELIPNLECALTAKNGPRKKPSREHSVPFKTSKTRHSQSMQINIVDELPL